MLQHVSLPGRQLHFPTSILFNTSRCFTLPFFMALVSVFLDQTTLVFFLLMPCLQYNKKHQERRIWDVFCKVLNLTTLNPPNRLLVLSLNIFCAKPPHDALNSRWLQQSFFVKKQTANFFFFPAFKLTPSARYLILGDRSTLTKISCSEKIVLIVVRWQIEPVVSFFFFFAFHL